MLVNLKTVLENCRKDQKAIGSFNCYNYETIKGVYTVLEENNYPGIIAFGENYLVNMELENVSAIVSNLVKDSKLPFCLHLDHCKSFDVIKKAIDAGFTSVMIDASSKSFEENVAITKEVVDYAHARGVSVEAELGCLSLGDYSNEHHADEIYTDPQQAKEFVERTNVDALAVSIGTVHGMYKGEAKVSVERLKEISDVVDIPLVLHGGSGTPEAVVKDCISKGICKINVNTEISMNVVAGIIKDVENPKIHYSVLSLKAIDRVKETVLKYAKVFANE